MPSIDPQPWSLRRAATDDAAFLLRMLGEAAYWRPESEVPDDQALLGNPLSAHYIAGWPRPDDNGVVATDNVDHEPVGSAWYRFLHADDPGYGYVADDIPEITIGVERAWRGRGVGASLLRALIERAAAGQVRALSLSVEHDNPAARLYERLGFTVVTDTGATWTMVRDLRDRP